MEAYIDGSSIGMYGYYIPSKKKKRVVYDQPLTNNQAEWLALVVLLLDALPGECITVYSDSQIVVNQLLGEWDTKNETLVAYRKISYILIHTKDLKVGINWIPREENKFGHHLEKLLKEKKARRKIIKKKIKRGFI